MAKTNVLRPAKSRSNRPAPSSSTPQSDTEIAPLREDQGAFARKAGLGTAGSGFTDEVITSAPTISELERRLPTHDEIAVRAFHLSERRRQAGEPGDEMGDWLQAEAELVGWQS
jgi:hypothetical protein